MKGGEGSAPALALALATAPRSVGGSACGSPEASEGHAPREALTSRPTAPSAERNPALTFTSWARSSASSGSDAVCVAEEPQPASRVVAASAIVVRRMLSATGLLRRGRATVRASRVRTLHAEQVHYEHERRVRRDRGRRAGLAIGKFRGNDQLAPSTHLHAGYALVPTLDDLALA
jgi:hypothetical protein